MDVLIATTGEKPQPWIDALSTHLPEARFRVWEEGDRAPADFIFVWRPPAAALRERTNLKAIFNLGAGVDALLKLEEQSPGALPPGVPLIRVDDAGMAAQMIEYTLYYLLREFRDLGVYRQQQARQLWEPLTPKTYESFPVAVMGLGELGAQVARAVSALGFPVRGWSRSAKQIDGVECYAGVAEFDEFVSGARVLVSLLPDTPETRGIMDRALFDKLAKGAFVINVARGTQIVDADLVAAIQEGQLSGAALDVFHVEPLDPNHPFWHEPRIDVTPHIAAATPIASSTAQMAGKIRKLLAGEPVNGVVDLSRGY